MNILLELNFYHFIQPKQAKKANDSTCEVINTCENTSDTDNRRYTMCLNCCHVLNNRFQNEPCSMLIHACLSAIISYVSTAITKQLKILKHLKNQT